MQKTARQARTTPRQRCGSILLECLLALALLVAAGVTVLGAMDRATSAAARMADEKDAADIAASAMSQIECGVLSIESVQGHSSKWRTGVHERAEWYVGVESEPTEFTGLTLVTLRVYRGSPGTTGSGEIPVATLQQYVRLSSQSAGPMKIRGGSGEQSSRRDLP